jgi:hypothetical protein
MQTHHRSSSEAALSRWIRLSALAALTATLAACATPTQWDYTAYKQSRPTTLLVLPPVNETPDVKATYGLLSQVTLPLAEAGYYVVPVSLMDETFRQNGLTSPVDIHAVPAQRLRDIFGADAAVLIKVTKYGTTYAVIASQTTVTAQAQVVDLKSGQLLWQGSASASSSESDGGNQGGLVGLLVKAVVTQIVGTATDASFTYAGMTSNRLLFPKKNGLLYGPRSPNYQKDDQGAAAK